jgi:hypothetical protein
VASSASSSSVRVGDSNDDGAAADADEADADEAYGCGYG